MATRMWFSLLTAAGLHQFAYQGGWRGSSKQFSQVLEKMDLGTWCFGAEGATATRLEDWR